MNNPPDYASGLGETIRAHRNYLGVGKDEMARQLGMNARSYERIENNQRACPPGLLDTIEKVADKFDADVVRARHKTICSALTTLTLTPSMDEWTRAVYGRAAVEYGRSLHSEP